MAIWNMAKLSYRVAIRYLNASRSTVLRAIDTEYGVDGIPPLFRGPEKGPWTGVDDYGRNVSIEELPDGSIRAKLDAGYFHNVKDLVRAMKSPKKPLAPLDSEVWEDFIVDMYWARPGDQTPIGVENLTPRGRQIQNNIEAVISGYVRRPLTNIDPQNGGLSTLDRTVDEYVADDTGLILLVLPFFQDDSHNVLCFVSIPQEMADFLHRLESEVKAAGGEVGSDMEEICRSETCDTAFDFNKSTGRFDEYSGPLPPFSVI